MVVFGFFIDAVLNYYKLTTLKQHPLQSIASPRFSAFAFTRPKSKYQQFCIPFWAFRGEFISRPMHFHGRIGSLSIVRLRSLLPCWISRIPPQFLDPIHVPWPVSPIIKSTMIGCHFPALSLSYLLSSHLSFASFYFSGQSFSVFTVS